MKQIKSLPLKSSQGLRPATNYTQDDRLLKFAHELQLLRKERKLMKNQIQVQSYKIKKLQDSNKTLEEQLYDEQTSISKKFQGPTQGLIKALEKQLRISINDNKSLYQQVNIMKKREDFNIYINLESQLKHVIEDFKKEQQQNMELMRKLGNSLMDAYQNKQTTQDLTLLDFKTLQHTESVEHFSVI
ncbi:hypothetical protein SS50377_25622 [Spironucleus salmonicida]|uniref:Uncharacterized protein n=1 Tax=Spironucleus salmonicida TaxID=348837 RepID=V6LXW0_9EUKA|nr:hypothetical protein SS50377_25622 [Spironucleus salmonicida]|eukprot:EST49477.1 Hypothetical protein SS50377_10226 [Spironucleus salmonicida]